MKFDELYAMIAVDFRIDATNLGGESIRSSDLFMKYIKLYTDEKLRLEGLENNKKTLIANRRNYYLGNGTPEEYAANPLDVKVKSSVLVEKMIDDDDEIIKYNQNLIIQREKVELLKACLNEIKQRGYNLKSAIEMLKFENGL